MFPLMKQDFDSETLKKGDKGFDHNPSLILISEAQNLVCQAFKNNEQDLLPHKAISI